MVLGSAAERSVLYKSFYSIELKSFSKQSYNRNAEITISFKLVITFSVL